FTCTGTPQSFTITVNPGIIITSQPQNVTLCAGGNATFSVTASGSGPFTYEWRNYGVNGGSYSVVGSNSSTLTLNNVTAAMSGNRYAVVVTGACASVTSNFAVLTVNPVPTAYTLSGSAYC